jgi:predicted secreted protein
VRKLRAELTAAPLAAVGTDPQRIQADKLAELGRLSAEQEIVLRDIAVRRENFEMEFPPLRKSKEIQSALEPRQFVWMFFAARDGTYAWLLSKNRCAAWKLESPPPLFEQKTAALLRALGNAEANRELPRSQFADESWRGAARDAFETLSAGSKVNFRAKIDELIIVPDGVLWELPFQALQSSAHRYVIEDMAVSYAPSITVLREMMRVHRDTPASRTLLAFGNPSADAQDALPETATEVHRLAEIYGASSRVLVGADAREDRWKAEAPDYRVVHLATHGVLDDASPLYSHLLLARPERGSKDDGLLEAWEIMNVPLNADLVILSACETARGRVAPGEGILGLMWAVFVAGSPATLVSQWRVDSASSTTLMVAFHREWNMDGGRISKARALQHASVEVLRTRGFSHPFFWAGFILAGDGR